MKRAIAGALWALAATHVAGCTSDEDPNDAFITARWSLVHLDTNTQIQCPVGFDTAALHSLPVDASGNETGTDIVDLFACASGRGTSAALVPGLYRSWIEIANSGVTDVFATSLSASVDVTSENRDFTTQILDDGGYFTMSWKLVGASSGDDLTCAQAAATNGVEAVATEVSTPTNSASDAFDCEDGSGVTAGYLAGTYTVSIAALGDGDDPIGSAPDLTDVVIDTHNAVTDLGLLTIPISGL